MLLLPLEVEDTEYTDVRELAGGADVGCMLLLPLLFVLGDSDMLPLALEVAENEFRDGFTVILRARLTLPRPFIGALMLARGLGAVKDREARDIDTPS